jgi:hypothetical protein
VFKDIVITEGPWNTDEYADSMWKKMTTHFRKITIEVFGVIRGNKHELDAWWWNDNVQKTISKKKECYERLHHHGSDENI